ncbi:MAG: flavodoxin family protein [Clostridia bacterium]|nr:flavodoxin family protein [Clostridia bacterium]
MKTAIIYYSKHHGNTKKLLDAIAEKHEVTLIEVSNAPADLSEYDRIGFASGIYYSKFQKALLSYAENRLPEGKKVFFLYTYGAEKKGYTKAITEAVRKHNSTILGEYGCFGFNTFGPFKLIGGMAKGHPDQDEIANAVKFYETIQQS